MTALEEQHGNDDGGTERQVAKWADVWHELCIRHAGCLLVFNKGFSIAENAGIPRSILAAAV